MKRSLFYFLATGALLVTSSALSQTIPAGDEAGRIQERFQRPRVPQALPTKRKGLESTMAPAEAAKVPLVLKGIRLTGNTAFADAEFADLYANLIGKRISLKDVFDVTAKITARYPDALINNQRRQTWRITASQSGDPLSLSSPEKYYKWETHHRRIGQTLLFKPEGSLEYNTAPKPLLNRSEILEGKIVGYRDTINAHKPAGFYVRLKYRRLIQVYQAPKDELVIGLPHAPLCKNRNCGENIRFVINSEK